MTREDFEKYRDIVREIEMLMERIKARPHVSDTVKGSSPNFPYIQHVVKVEGIAPDVEDQDTAERRILRNDVMKKGAIECEIYAADEKYRRILIAYFIDGKSQDEIAEAEHYDQKTISNRIAEYFKTKGEKECNTSET